MLFSIGSRPMLGKSDLNDHRCLDPYRKLLEVLDLGQMMAASPPSATGHRNANLTQPPKESKSWSPQMEKDLEIRDFQVVTCMLLYQLFFKMCLVLVNFGGGFIFRGPSLWDSHLYFHEVPEETADQKGNAAAHHPRHVPWSECRCPTPVHMSKP